MGPMDSAIDGLKQATNFYARDLDVLGEEQILGCAGGSARKPVDFTYEVALINLRIASRLKGGEPPATPVGEAWWIAPDELRSKADIAEYFRCSSEALISAAEELPEDEVGKMVGSPGFERPAYAMVNF